MVQMQFMTLRTEVLSREDARPRSRADRQISRSRAILPNSRGVQSYLKIPASTTGKDVGPGSYEVVQKPRFNTSSSASFASKSQRLFPLGYWTRAVPLVFKSQIRTSTTLTLQKVLKVESSQSQNVFIPTRRDLVMRKMRRRRGRRRKD